MGNSRIISKKQRAFSLIVRLLGKQKVDALLKEHIGDFELPSTKTLSRWKNCNGIPIQEDTGTNAFYKTSQQEFFKFQRSLLTHFWSDNDMMHLNNKLLRADIDYTTHQFPAVCLIDKVSIHPKLTFNHQPKAASQAFIAQIKQARQHITDNPTFAISSLDLSVGEVHCTVSSYFRALYHCDRYYYHMITEFKGSSKRQFQAACDRSYISQWQSQLKNIVINNDFSNIEASLGGSCLFMFYDETIESYAYLISNKVQEANGVGEKHVLPSFMLQPLAIDFLVQHHELDFKKQLFRELLEEVIGHDDYEPQSHHEAIYDDIMNHDCICDLQLLLKSGGAELHFTGLWLDFYRLRPEITSVLIIHDTDWVKKHLQQTNLGNWETQSGGLLKLSLNDEETYQNILNAFPNPMCPPGLAALITGRELAMKVCAT